MAVVTIDIDTRQVQAMLGRAPGLVKQRLNRTLMIAAIETQREMRIAAPVAVTGDLRKSVKYDVSGLAAKIGPTAKYADRVELGGGPKWYSVAEGEPLRAWADSKGINPWAVRNSIAKKGTKPHPFVAPTFTLMEPRIERLFEEAIEDLTGELSRG